MVGPVSSELRKLCTRLAPLRQVEEDLNSIICGGSRPASFDGSRPRSPTQPYNPAKATEVSIRPGSRWKQALSFKRNSVELPGSRARSADRTKGEQSRRILAALGDDIASLWRHAAVQQSLKTAEIALHEQPGL